MNRDWQFVKGVSAGGTILSLTGKAGDLWAGSPAGLFHQQGERWKPILRGIPFVVVNVVTSALRYLFAAGLPAGIVRSRDGGASWQACRVDQIHTPVNCIQASPNFQRDGVILAGTNGDGVLRSTDSGRSWRLSNFGLRNFAIFSLASAPRWGRREYIYAGTDHGVYQSPNGGRAWRPAGLDGHSILTLALSPDFDRNGVLLAGTAEGETYKSMDGGRNWSQVKDVFGGANSINVLQFSRGGRLWLGTDLGGIFSSQDEGYTWQLVYQESNSVLTLDFIGEGIYAGFQDLGIYHSNESGEDWDKMRGLNARRFNWFVDLPSHHLATGMYEDFWMSARDENEFSQTGSVQELSPITDITAMNDMVVLSKTDGVWAADPSGDTYTRILDTEETVLSISVRDGQIWAGGEFGSLWKRSNQEGEWECISKPFGGDFPIVSIQSTPGLGEATTLVAAVGTRKRPAVRMMRSQDGGDHWEPWLEVPGDWRGLRVSVSGVNARRILVAIGTTCYWLEDETWQKAVLTPAHSPITAVLVVPETDLQLAAAPERLYLKQGSGEWQDFSHGLDGETIVDLRPSINFSEDSKLLGLTLDGRLYSREV